MIVPLTQGYAAIIDEADAALVGTHQWRIHRESRDQSFVYAVSGWQRGRVTRMHRLIIGATPGTVVDHINGNTLDNRRENLRVCTRTDNARNRRASSKSGFKGVYLHAKSGKWHAAIKADKVHYNIGRYDCPIEAARAYDAAAARLHGAFARLNFPEA